jgi:hypothetical protein
VDIMKLAVELYVRSSSDLRCFNLFHDLNCEVGKKSCCLVLLRLLELIR